MTTPFPLAFDAAAQSILEAAVPEVAAGIGGEPSDAWEATDYKPQADEKLAEDRAAHEVWARAAAQVGAVLISEESPDETIAAARADFRALRFPSPYLLVDPIDGSSEWHRMGPHRTPLATAALLVHYEPHGERIRGTLLAAVVGDMWQQRSFGLRPNGAASVDWQTGNARLIASSPAKRSLPPEQAMVAAYSPGLATLDLLRPTIEMAPYFHNNGGMLTALRVVDAASPRSYAVSIEPRPSAIWEHAGPILAAFSGAAVSRLDGTPLSLNPFVWQTSITAANQAIASAHIEALAPSYRHHRMPHEKEWQ